MLPFNDSVGTAEGLSTQYDMSLAIVEALIQAYGPRTSRVLDALKKPSKRFFFRVNTIKGDVGDVLSKFEDYGLKVRQDPCIPEAFSMEVEGPFDLPSTSKSIVADRLAAESVIQGVDLFAPGVVKCQGVTRNDVLTVVNDQEYPVAVGVAQMSEKEILTLRSGVAVKTLVSRYRVPSLRDLPEYSDGLVYAQSFPAMLSSRVLDPQPGETIIDFCSSPGGKLTHAAQLMNDKGNLIAVDRSPRKIEKIRLNLHRLGIRNVKILQEDSRYLDLSFPGLKADRILIDPPCSALGLRPRLYGNLRRSELSSFASYQAQFFRPAISLLRDGGIILYSTCTLTLSENEQLIDNIMKEYGLELLNQSLFLGSHGIEGFGCSGSVQRFHLDIHDTCGFFVALLRKTR